MKIHLRKLRTKDLFRIRLMFVCPHVRSALDFKSQKSLVEMLRTPTNYLLYKSIYV